jgi:hypothetical protein
VTRADVLRELRARERRLQDLYKETGKPAVVFDLDAPAWAAIRFNLGRIKLLRKMLGAVA